MTGEDRSFADPGTDRPLLAVLRKHGGENAHLAIAGALLQLLGNLPAQAGPALAGYMFDSILREEPFAPPLIPDAWIPTSLEGQLWFAVGLFVGLGLVHQATVWLNSMAWGAFAYRAQHDVRTSSYDLTQRLEMGFFDGHQTGEVMSVLNNDVNEMEGFLTGTLSDAVNITGMVLGITLFMLLLNWQFALVALAVAPVMVVANYWFSGVIEAVYDEVRQAMGELNAQMRNSIGGIGVIKAYTAEGFERDRVESASSEHYEAQMRGIRTRSKHYPSMRVLTGLGLTLTFGIGGYWVMRGPPLFFTEPLSLGAFVTFVLYAQHIMWPMRDVAKVIDGYKSAKSSATRILALQNASEGVTEPDDPVAVDTIDGDVAYDDVTFSYDAGAEPAVEDVSFAVDAGETVGIVGATGAGKSTLLKLLLRYYDPDAGSIRIDGTDVREMALTDLRSNVGYISQDPFLFSGTVLENVAYGMPDADIENVRRATERAGALEFVEELDDGFETTIGERGVKLSGGQRQRLAIARTILQDPDVLVLDEATSHVDNETEALIQRSLSSIVEDKTTLVVAHRLSTVRDADRILVLEDGRLAESGTHDGLLEADGLYANLWRVQAGEVQALPDEFLERVQRRADDVASD